MKRILIGLGSFIILLVLIFFLGPKVEKPNLDRTLPELSVTLSEIDNYVNEKEEAIPYIKPGNASRIVWFDSIPKKTKYSIVYLHGWSASSEEGAPLHIEMAKQYGCNLYLPRLAGHGLNEREPMLNLTADRLINSAKEAIAIAKKIGDKVIVMGTSTGATLALHLAAKDEDIAALLLYSPNIEIYDKNSKLLAGPWGLQLVRTVKKSNYHRFKADSLKEKYWTAKYRVEALTHLQALVDNTMKTSTFELVQQPVFMGYFYKNDSIQDKVISVPAALKMFEELATPSDLKRKVAFPDVNDHVMTSYITSKDLPSVQIQTSAFIEEVLHIKPINN